MRCSRTPAAAALAVAALAWPAAAGAGGAATTVRDPHLPAPGAAELPPVPPGAAAPPRAGAAQRGPTVRGAVAAALAAGSISQAEHDAYRALYIEARRTRARLSGARAANLGDVIATLERIARAGALSPERMPVLFLQLRRNSEYWARRGAPKAGARVVFAGSPLVFQHYPGRGLQIQPLANFGKANSLWSHCKAEREGKPGFTCEREDLRELLDWMLATAGRRGRFTSWEYFFAFGGGAPPWVSGLAQGTAVQALARGHEVLGDPAYLAAARGALGAFEAAPPTGIRRRARGGSHYLIYSFAPRLLVLNGFLQSLIGLHDYARITGDARGLALFRSGDRRARREVPLYDTGDWSLYSRPGTRADVSYHRLVRDFLRGLCSRTQATVYCRYAERFTDYLRRRQRTGTRPEGPTRTGGGAPVTLAPLSSDWRVAVEVTDGRRRLVLERTPR